MIAEIRYGAGATTFTEFRMVTDVQGTLNSNIYLVSSAAKSGTGSEFTQTYYQSFFFKIDVDPMAV
jgi:hypothetical protein